MLKISPVLQKQWKDKDVFEQVLSIQGKIFREKDGRKTLSFSCDGVNYFAKIHQGVGWKKIFKYLLQFKLPVLSAKNEWEAISKLEKLGINTTPLEGYGIRGFNPSSFQSFVITRELTEIESLEDFCRNWPTQKPKYTLKKALINEVAKIARIIHENGITHRDFYICHFLIDIGSDKDQLDPNMIKLYLIDLHRVQIHRKIPRRLKIKDIAGLYFSSMDIGLSKRDLLRFIRAYQGQSIKKSLKNNKFFWWLVNRRGISLYKKIFKTKPILPD